MDANTYNIQVSQLLQQPVEIVWKALTEVSQMTQWFFENIPDFRPETGFEICFDVHSGGRRFPHRWRVREVIPSQKLSLNWSYDSYPGTSIVSFYLKEEENGCQITVIHEGMDSFPQDIPEFSAENCQGGWDYFIVQRLQEYCRKMD
ncbi:MAG: SRPBCC domain-containing protein [Bacteroidetes bacterium]|nr:MAG: SRPBCC domain-containing protein [Bacteroidota bacterium]